MACPGSASAAIQTFSSSELSWLPSASWVGDLEVEWWTLGTPWAVRHTGYDSSYLLRSVFKLLKLCRLELQQCYLRGQVKGDLLSEQRREESISCCTIIGWVSQSFFLRRLQIFRPYSKMLKSHCIFLGPLPRTLHIFAHVVLVEP